MRTVRKKILIVDDIQMFIQLQKTLLNRQDFTLLDARTGREALDKAREENPDLIILDLYMPDMDGYAVCREIKNDPATNHIPILIITTDDAKEFRELCIEAGCDGYLTKPIRKDTLIPAIENHLQTPPQAAQESQDADPLHSYGRRWGERRVHSHTLPCRSVH